MANVNDKEDIRRHRSGGASIPSLASPHPIQGRRIRNKALALVVILLTAAGSLTVGVGSMSLGDLWSGDGNNAALLLMASRIPRTLALILAGAGLAVSGAIMQMLARNRFAEPSTVGTADSAALGMIVALAIAPQMPVLGKMALAGGFAVMGTAIFLAILRQVPLRSALMVPLIGIMFGGVVSAMGTFLAYRFDLLQSIGAWSGGDFSMVLRGRYELLWIALALTLVAYAAAARFTLAGLGEAVARNLGLDYRAIVALGLLIVSLVTASVVVTVGMVPFVGLVVPNLVSLLLGDNLQRTLPWVTISGAGLMLFCDLVGRLVIFPYEIPVGTVAGVIGAIFFLYLLLRRQPDVA